MQRLDGLRELAGRRSQEESRAVERFLAEIEFAGELAETEGRGEAWAPLIEESWRIVEQAAAPAGRGTLAAAVARAEGVLAPVAAAAKAYTILCVGHAHIDMNWMWSWPETVHTVHDTFTTVLKLMDEFPDFCFTQSQASVYEIVERYHPEMLEPIRAQIRAGRWEVAACHWVESDRNLPGGEALARHLLYTRRYIERLLGLPADAVPLGWTPDSFGHAHTIPSIDARGGVRYLYLCRAGAGRERPPVFWFQGPDGARVLVCRELTWYNDTIGPHNTKPLLLFARQTGLKTWMNVYGVGDHGGGPTRRDLRRCHDLNTWPVFPHYRLATAGAFFDLLARRDGAWPVVDGELNFEFPGCYTSQTLIKRNNRLGEIHAAQAEWAALLGARLAGLDYPADELERIWRDVCFSQFHDILPGSGVAATRTYNDGMFQRLAAAGSMIRMRALRAVAARIDTRSPAAAGAAAEGVPPERESVALGAGPGSRTQSGGVSTAGHVGDGPRPFVVFNPLAQERTEIVTATVWDPQTGRHADDLANKHYAVCTADGRRIPAQKVNQGAWYWANQFIEVAFPMSVGPLGHAVCTVVDDGTRFRPPANAYGYGRFVPQADGGVRMLDGRMGIEAIAVGGCAMENEHLSVAFDARSGGIVSLIDKATGRELADPAHPLAVLEFIHERPGSMTAWTISDAYRRQDAEVVSLDRRHGGPWLASIIARSKVGSSEVSVTYTLKSGHPWLEIEIQTRWLEIGSAAVGIPKLAMRFPLALEEARASYEIPFGSIRRAEHDGEEVPGLRWADVTGRSPSVGGEAAGCALFNDSKYGFSLDNRTLRVTLIRSSYDPDPLPEVGEHVVRLALQPHGGARTASDLTRLGAAFNEPLQVIAAEAHDGVLPAVGATLRVEPANVVVAAVKRAEDTTDAIVVRLVELDGRAVTARVTFDPVLLGQPQGAVEVDLLERATHPSAARVEDGVVAVPIVAHAIVSLRVTLSAASGQQAAVEV